MKKSKEELNRIHKEKCKELKKIRAKMAEDLGVDLQQRECTYEGYCSGSCPKCKSEEWKLNAAIMKKQMEEADLKRRVAAVGLTTMAALCISGCSTSGRDQVDGSMEYKPFMEEEEEVEGLLTPEEDPEEEAGNQPSAEDTEEGTENQPSVETPEEDAEWSPNIGDTEYLPYTGEIAGGIEYLPYEEE